MSWALLDVVLEQKLPLAVTVFSCIVLARLMLKPSSSGSPSRRSGSSSGKRAGVLDASEWTEFPLVERIEINHNVRLFRFGLPTQADVLGLPIGQHVSVSAEIEGKTKIRSYTPVSSDDDKGHFDLVIKVYPQGAISSYLDQCRVGDMVKFRGPKGKFVYKPNMSKRIGMLAGGTGITPMLQIIRAIAKNPADVTEVSLIFANVTEDDILLREELEAVARDNPRFHLHYTLDKPPADWKYSSGFVTEDLIRKHLPAPASDVKILACGPPPMIKFMKGHFENIGYVKDEHYFTF